MFHVCLCYVALPIHCSLVITCWGRADLLCVMFSYAIVPYGVSGRIWCLVLLIPDIYLLFTLTFNMFMGHFHHSVRV